MDKKNTRIGILTFHKAINYGSVLQAWALQQTLKTNEYDSEIIDYEPKELKHLYETRLKDAKGFKRKLKRFLSLKGKVFLQREKFQCFRKEDLYLSKERYTYNSDFGSIADKYDVIITGSDQVWNTNIEDCDPVFFLPFPFKGKKIAYACSVNEGRVNERFPEEWLNKWLQQYNFISVREQSGVEKVSSFLDNNMKIYNTLDPTLLLDKEMYNSLIGEKIKQEHYIFLYNMWTKMEGIQVARKISEKLGLPVYTLTNQMDMIRIIKYSSNGVKVDLQHTGPKDFLNYIYYSDFVITDSFHGTAFSIIFNKEFLTLNAHTDNGKYKNDERLKNILSHESLSERFVKIGDIDSFDLRKKIDYKIVNEYRENLKSQSLCLLFDAIEGRNNL
ncbi:polysaccharide pyruvyl transferase family protein [Blautia wexlerae]|uniref:Polysaccharide pyruvyl transferase family protein n=1 Tax=Blautia wexlerae TaxID=418240 RepID=A0ABX2GTR7_9FIRM|nr:polysaccharide pyruvyl transferase family protein [Blautia wexlerae]NSF75159.1 polysaccharide pyruvyl transferase family protein [Blautia wexlerae]